MLVTFRQQGSETIPTALSRSERVGTDVPAAATDPSMPISGGKVRGGSMRRALLILVGVVLLPLLVVQMAVCWAWFHGRRVEEEQANLELGRAVGSAFETAIRDVIRNELAIGSALSELQPYSPLQASRFLATAAAQYPLISSWSWIDPSGTVLASSETTTVGRAVLGSPYAAALTEGHPSHVDVIDGPAVPGRPTVMVTQRITRPDGGLLGVVAATIETRALGEVIGARDRGERGSISLFDGRGRLVYGSPARLRGHNDWTDDDPLLDAVLAGGTEETGTFRSPLDDTTQIAARVPIPRLGWVAGASRPLSVAMAEVRKAFWLVIGLNILVAMLSVGAAATLSRRIIAPLHRLRDHARAMGRGDLDHRTEVGGIRELQELAVTFNRIAGRIRSAQNELARANGLLEKRVAERTAELERTTSQLRSLAWKITRSEERERRRLALLLHDHLQQLLVAARLQVETATHGVEDAAVRGSLNLTVDWLNEAIAESRSLTVELSPPVLYSSGLAAALEWLAQHKAKKYGLAVDVVADPAADPTDIDTSVVLFQAVRELLFNVVKHARTDRAEVRMGLVDGDPDLVQVVVRDHGAGFDATALQAGSTAGFGIFAVRERLGMMGGTLQFNSARGEGTRIVIHAPRDRAGGASAQASAGEA